MSDHLSLSLEKGQECPRYCFSAGFPELCNMGRSQGRGSKTMDASELQFSKLRGQCYLSHLQSCARCSQ